MSTVAPGDPIYRQGAPAHRAHLLLKGAARLLWRDPHGDITEAADRTPGQGVGDDHVVELARRDVGGAAGVDGDTASTGDTSTLRADLIATELQQARRRVSK